MEEIESQFIIVISSGSYAEEMVKFLKSEDYQRQGNSKQIIIYCGHIPHWHALKETHSDLIYDIVDNQITLETSLKELT